MYPTANPTADPTIFPTISPTTFPTISPTIFPTVYPTTNPTVYPTSNPTANPTVYHVNAANWTLQTSPPIPTVDMRRVIGYDSKNQIVWLLGGYYNKRKIISFNILNTTYTEYAVDLTNDIESLGQNYAQKDNILYIAMSNTLYQYNMSNTVSNLESLSTIPRANSQYGCLAVIDNYLVLTADVYVYNIITSTWTKPPNTPSMIAWRYWHSCQVSSDKYLYLIGGYDNGPNHLNSIEKLYVGDIPNILTYKWTLLVDTLSIGRMWAPSVIFNDYIYFIGGLAHTNGGGREDVVDIIDTINDNVFSMQEPLYEPIYWSAAAMVAETIYVFGGDASTKRTYYQYYTLPISRAPTQVTLSPTLPTATHSNVSTVYPTFNPTIYPTFNPTIYPTFNPTISATTFPTISATENPTTNTTIFPTISPTTFPTISPTRLPTANINIIYPGFVEIVYQIHNLTTDNILIFEQETVKTLKSVVEILE
eukprot:19516_1